MSTAAAHHGSFPGSIKASGLTQRLQLEDRVPRRYIVERFHRRSFRDREESLNLAIEAVKIGFENRWTHPREKLAHGIAMAAHCADEHHFACRAGIAHPVGIAAGANEITPPLEFEQIDRQRDCLATLPAPDFENVEVAADQANPDTNASV